MLTETSRRLDLPQVAMVLAGGVVGTEVVGLVGLVWVVCAARGSENSATNAPAKPIRAIFMSDFPGID